MESLVINMTNVSPEIILDHKENKFHIKGSSRPEDVRELYYPIVEWMHNYRHFLHQNKKDYSKDKPLNFEFDLEYFNSSSAKFLYDIVYALKEIHEDGTPTQISWLYDHEDIDMMEAGEDLAYLAEIDFVYIKK